MKPSHEKKNRHKGGFLAGTTPRYRGFLEDIIEA
jgi:hypothetical protein